MMATVFQGQLDFIFFFYGLAFILLGAVSVAIARLRNDAWTFLGLFAFVHGACEWLDLIALASDNTVFMTVRVTLMATSFLLLMEFARRKAGIFGLKMPGRWIYAMLALIVLVGGLFGGLTTAAALARYCIGFVAALETSFIFAYCGRALAHPARRLVFCCSAGFAAYAVLGGLIVPAAPFWPATILNQTSFADMMGIPIQLLRGLVACMLATLIWSIRGRLLVEEVASERYTAYQRQQYAWTVIAMLTILACGWVFTDYLGDRYRKTVQLDAQSDIGLIAGQLSAETGMLDGMVKALAGSPSLLPLLTGSSQIEERRARSVLDLDVDAAGARFGYVLDRSGRVVASSSRRETHIGSAPEFSLGPSFEKSLAGEAGYMFSHDPAAGQRFYTASYPIRDDDGAIVGVAMLRRSLKRFEEMLSRFDRPTFFVDPSGIVVLTNFPDLRFRRFWPVSPEVISISNGQPGASNLPPLLNQNIEDAAWTTFGGEQAYLRRRYADHSRWSIVMVTPTKDIYANRLLGIVITLLAMLMTLMYFFGREHGVRDSVQRERRSELQRLASSLRRQAATDRLTGLYNRSKFDETLAQEISRAQRSRTSFALVLFDIDHFKQVNDLHGHQAGDRVLVQLSQRVSGHLRETDFLARWGGEEFVILIPGLAIEAARPFTEKLRLAISREPIDEVGTITCSFGITQFVAGDTGESLMARADHALYRAKINGRNRTEIASPSELTRSVA
jgi:diguanylate cyclase (GGDEF)-like protein